MQELQNTGAVSGEAAKFASMCSQHILRLLEEKRNVSRKRAKDFSSGIVSPHTSTVRPSAKHQYDLLWRSLPANSSQSISSYDNLGRRIPSSVDGVSKLQADKVT